MTSDQGDKPRGGRGRYVRSTATAEKDAEACRLRSLGYSLQEIADALQLGHREQARRAVERGLTAIVQPAAEAVRAMELEKLDRLEEVGWRVLRREHIVSQNGRVVRGEDGQPLADDGPTLAAIDTLLRVQTRRAKLLGLDAPTRAQVSVNTPDPEVQREIAEIMQQVIAHQSCPVPLWHPEATREARDLDG